MNLVPLDSLIDLGISFHSTPALYVKDLITNLDLGVGRCRSLPLRALLRPRVLVVTHNSLRYLGHSPLRHRFTTLALNNFLLCLDVIHPSVDLKSLDGTSLPLFRISRMPWFCSLSIFTSSALLHSAQTTAQ